MMTETACVVCGKQIVHDKFHPYQKYCSKRCKWRLSPRNEQKKKRYHQLRFKALGVLGGKCSICGIDDPCMLTIDHIDGDWRKDPFQGGTNGHCIGIFFNIMKPPRHISKFCAGTTIQ